MDEITLNTWGEFESQLNTLDELRQNRLKIESTSSSKYLYRGHGDSTWSLETTLDRFFQNPISLANYYRYALVARSRIEAFTGVHWTIPTRDEYEQWLENHDSLIFHDFKAYDYLAYLRHHGFPSPLLDWTSSPYVAAFFAFRNVSTKTEFVSVYVFQERPGIGKITSSNHPIIHSLGPYVSSHKRHFLQQSQYTFCTKINENGVVYYTKHQDVVAQNELDQDLMWKINIPASERRTALTRLNQMNINAFSLFGSEDSLIETVAVSDIYVHGRDI